MRISDWSSYVCSSDLGLRLEEASGLLADELAAIDHDHDQAQQLWLRLPPPLTKGDRGRSVLVPRRLLRQIAAYVAVERAAGVTKFAARDGAAKLERPIPVTRAGLDRMRDVCTPAERCRLILFDEDGTPHEPAALWLTGVRSDARRVGEGVGSTGRIRWSAVTYKK